MPLTQRICPLQGVQRRPHPTYPESGSHWAATKGKKRTTESDASTVSSKRQKKANAMAEPTGGNSIKNICMCQWNATQPGGQGLLRKFNSYFKTLLEADKEPFKKELHAAQVAARKVKTAAKKGTGVTNGT
ncbi:hypothetical protein H4582DRAFT_2065694 [Lactarius indigo]|nr:hypothetical protein H4582DRAFT_2065694 [Lactarius indigo]